MSSEMQLAAIEDKEEDSIRRIKTDEEKGELELKTTAAHKKGILGKAGK